ncbi:hypothetical protein EVAR_103562_1 [Eumeta japonica]|uniref:Uncharacterized protein n=1 Tax=Eumeta variegata TaxID=151549 RepID=A0A4C1YF98_EUMVA|nr:hypothetical protein EVAR_103562_1 [Eumeta japonica]
MKIIAVNLVRIWISNRRAIAPLVTNNTHNLKTLFSPLYSRTICVRPAAVGRRGAAGRHFRGDLQPPADNGPAGSLSIGIRRRPRYNLHTICVRRSAVGCKNVPLKSKTTGLFQV